MVGATPPNPSGQVAILLPLTGPNAGIAADMLNAARLALSVPGSPGLDIRDTGGDPQRAAAAAQAAMAHGDPIILGPLTAVETQAVAGVTGSANVPVLAFTSDPAVARPGIWTLGLTPAQQMRRLIAAARDDGRTRIAAILPPGPFGDALQSALSEATSDAGLEPPTIARSDGTLAGFTTALKTVTQFEQRRGDLDARLRAMRESTDPDQRRQAAQLAAQPVAPVPFDALLLGENGPLLRQGAEELSGFDVNQPQVRVLGPATWAAQSSHLGRLAGAWYAALDDSTRPPFVHAFELKYGHLPSPLADLAFDAAAIARVLAGEHDFSADALTRSEGFTGVDGAILLLADGRARRALAVYQLLPGGGARIVSPAPTDLASPPS